MSPTLLIVDDDPVFRRLARQLLSPSFSDVEEASDRPSALGAIARRRPRLVLVDLNLGEASGLELAAEIGARAGAPAVVLTSSGEPGLDPDALHPLGVRAFIRKAELSAAALLWLL